MTSLQLAVLTEHQPRHHRFCWC